ncbi:hypothetical protein LPB86_01695 [Pedobacter sp. MC2016-14]|nr:hypothetical protein [Pedobacter sp. MC2016-14]MCD0486922.1 hypothetical protein [Pedobacter sp. MC2016-14]
MTEKHDLNSTSKKEWIAPKVEEQVIEATNSGPFGGFNHEDNYHTS